MDARWLASYLHQGQKYGDQPYISHLDDVVSILKEFGHTAPDILAAGYLHDSLEDTVATPFSLLQEGVYPTSVWMVEFCTDAKGHATRKDRKAATYAKCQEILQGDLQDLAARATVVKVADRLANMRSALKTNPAIFRMYLKEMPGFKNCYYVPGQCDPMWKELHGFQEGQEESPGEA